MREPTRNILVLVAIVALTGAVAALDAWQFLGRSSEVIVVASAQAGVRADFYADGQCDEEQINAAIHKLPEQGGTVQLTTGTFSICAHNGTFGGIIIDRSTVTLAGQGPATSLVLADNQNTNVIRVVGSVHDIIIEKMHIDGNRWGNPDCDRKSTEVVMHDGFECNGIKAHYLTPDDYRAGANDELDKQIRRIWVREVIAENANGLNIMISARYADIVDSWVGGARSDSAEILVGPGHISRTTVVIDGPAGYALSTDGADNVQVSNNIVHVTSRGVIDQALMRTWKGSVANQITDNLFFIEPYGKVGSIMEINSDKSMVNDNLVNSWERAGGWLTQDTNSQEGNLLFMPNPPSVH